jgi:hypothetical protein
MKRREPALLRISGHKGDGQKMSKPLNPLIMLEDMSLDALK